MVNKSNIKYTLGQFEVRRVVNLHVNICTETTFFTNIARTVLPFSYTYKIKRIIKETHVYKNSGHVSELVCGLAVALMPGS